MNEFKKKPLLYKWYLKAKDWEEYKNYKFLKKVSELQQHTEFTIPVKEAYHFKHSGNAGDIIYALPTVYALAGKSNIHLHLKVGVKGHYGKKPHPLGSLMLNEKMVHMLQPLLLSQLQISSCNLYAKSDAIDFDLDLIRTYPFPLNRGNIARWYFYVFAVNADLGKPWLTVVPDTNMNEYIVIARSQRYRNPGIDYTFLKHYKKVIFVGIEQEWMDMKQMLPQVEYYPVTDFLQMASAIAGSKLFIGNQSFPFSLAEALKIKRLLEVYHLSPNVSVEGSNGYDFCFQPQFEKLVKEIYERD